MGNAITYVSISELVPSEFHPHLEFQTDNLDNLTNSIKNLGIIEPLIVRKKDDKYEIIIGNRRYNAAKQLGIEKIPVIVENVNDEQALKMIITNNVQRKELTGKEEALLYEKAISYPNMNAEQLSINLGVPIDRIISKLKIIKRKEQNNNQILVKKDENEQLVSTNNLINNDIININELEKSDIRRERVNMNDNQFMPNNNEAPMNQEPTFGGRFFPSAEEQGVPANNMQEGMQSMPNPEVAPEMPNNIPGSEPLSIPNIENIQPAEPAPMPEPVPQMMPTPEPEMTVPTPGMGIPTFENNIDPMPVGAIEATPINEVQPPQFDAMAPENPVPEMAPAPEMNYKAEPNYEMPAPEMNDNPAVAPMPNMDNIPNINIPEQPAAGKDITPLVNMIKNLVNNMEMLGYNIIVNENDGVDRYSINIEVEK